ncbi:hypothetical protein WJX72_006851 [[Myrmecia] bisecta]|uniref:Uncharacterized protein n=1 Tax=[Myrmecia] bisecta TaxID=41462 RepID=A0AAW1QAC5_9CHLO
MLSACCATSQGGAAVRHFRQGAAGRPHWLVCRAALPRAEDAGQENQRPSRRQALLLAASALLAAGPAQANVAQEFVKGYMRPEVETDQAVVKLIDARGTLCELKQLAATPMDSRERFEARRLLPGMAKRLREVGPAAPVVISLVSNLDQEASLSEMYGGKGGEQGLADAVYIAIGQVVTISGRTIRKEAQASPERAEHAIQQIDALLNQLPKNVLSHAEELRSSRNGHA